MDDGSSAVDRIVPSAIDRLPLNVAILDDDGVIRWTNESWRQFGAANDLCVEPDMIGKDYLKATANGDSKYARRAHTGIESLLSGERARFELEYPCHSPEEKRWFLMQAGAFHVDDESYVVVAHIDVTDRVLREREARRFERAADHSGHAIVITDRDGVIEYVNTAFESITGYSYEEAIGRNPRILKSGEHGPVFYEELWATILGGDVWKGTVVNRRKSGGLYYAHMTIAPVVDQSGTIVEFVAIQTDITDIEERKQQLQALDDVLRHDLRTELNLIQGHAEMLETSSHKRTETDDFEIETHTTRILEAVERLLSTAEKGRKLSDFLERETAPRPVDIAAITADVVSEQTDRFPEATIEYEPRETTSCLAVEEIDVAIAELIENGVRHNDREQSLVEVEIEADTNSEWVELRIGDNGPGISPMEYEGLRGRKVTSVAHGQGFGLNMAYWIVRRSGGRLLVSDRTPRGSVVTIRLPTESGNDSIVG